MRLSPQPFERFDGHRRWWGGCLSKRLDRRDAGLDQPAALGRSHPRNKEQIALALNLRGAPLATPACTKPRVAPRRGCAGCRTFDDEAAQAGPLAAKDRHDVVDAVCADRPVAEQQLDSVASGDAEPVELRDVGGELQERRHTRSARQLAVLHHVAPIGLPDQEVGEPDELVGRKRRLKHDVDARGKRGHRVVNRARNRVVVSEIWFGHRRDALPVRVDE